MDAVINMLSDQILQKYSQFAGQQLFYLLQYSGTIIMSQQLREQLQIFMPAMHELVQSLSDSMQQNPSNLLSIVNVSFSALWKLSKELLLETPCHKLLNLSVQTGHNRQLCSKVSAKQLKDLLREAVLTSQTQQKCNQQHNLHSSLKGQVLYSTGAIFSTSTFKIILRSQLSKVMEEVLSIFSLNYALKFKSRTISFAWKQDACLKVFEENINKIISCKNVQEIFGIINNGKTQVSRNVWNYAQEDRQLLKFKILLSKLQGESSLKQELLQLFSKKCSKQKQNEGQLQNWINCSSELKDTIKLQMNQLQKQALHCNELKQHIEVLKQQLSCSQQRIKEIEAQVQKISQQLTQLKHPISMKQEPQESYYINPYYQKSQYEEKLFMQMIQTQSDLLLGKQQIKMMGDSIIDLIKISLNSLEELQPSRYFLASFSRAVLKIVKDIKSLQGIDMEGLLNVKEDSHSLYDSEHFEQNRKSEISTFSQIQLDQKMSRLTEDDSLSLTNNDQ